MPDWIVTAGGWVIQIATVGAAIIVIWKWFAKPLGNVNEQLKAVNSRLDVIQEDTGDILCDRLTQAHDYHTRKGFCTQGDKARLVAMHKRYTDLGRNHLASTYEQDLLKLPEEPARKEVKL